MILESSNKPIRKYSFDELIVIGKKLQLKGKDGPLTIHVPEAKEEDSFNFSYSFKLN